ncbi:tetratricopeptide repeat protein 25-like [Myzus persicae]|uniref:tetratricopeptide repeat protein 25-like n=1 Tax=Myzus persicae TaxID=13164 RepID=UPI000B936112|nr:tetratricopeptide repeat protein 25-like [Myzus persicae]
MFRNEVTGPKLWFNEILVTKSIAKREFQKHNYEIAAQYCEKVLAVSGNDLSTRILLSKCQQNLFQPKLAYTNHLLAEAQFPDELSVLENRASIMLDNEEFEESLITYLNGAKKRIQPLDFILGVLKVSEIINGSTNLKKEKYRKPCLGNAVIKLANLGGLDNVAALHSILSKTKRTCKKKNQSFYLGRLAQDKKYFDKVLKSGGPKRPFYEAEKKMLGNMKRVVDTLNVAYEQFYKRKQIFVYKCEEPKMKGDRLLTQINNSKLVKDMGHLMICKYLNIIIQLLTKNEIKEAKLRTELMIEFMEKKSYKFNKILDAIYQSFGIAQYLSFQNINRWSIKDNHQRMLIFLGAAKNNIPLHESVFGPYDINPKITINKLRARVEKTNSIIEKIYIYYEKAKCHLDLGDLKKARNKTTKCLQLAKEINNHTWTVNALILLVSIEFQLDNKPKCCNILYKAIEIANNLQVPGVIVFLDKVAKMIFETKAIHTSSIDKKIMDVLNFMPDVSARVNAMCRLKLLSTMPINL